MKYLSVDAIMLIFSDIQEPDEFLYLLKIISILNKIYSRYEEDDDDLENNPDGSSLQPRAKFAPKLTATEIIQFFKRHWKDEDDKSILCHHAFTSVQCICSLEYQVT